MDKIKEYIELVMEKFSDNKKLIIIGLVLVAIIIFAGSIQAGQPYQTYGRGGTDGQQQDQKQSQGQAQGQHQSSTNTNDNDNRSTAVAGSSSNSGAYSSSGGNRIHADGGRSESSSSATSGDSRATGGVGVGVGRVGDTTSSSGGNAQDISIEGDTDNSETTLTYEGDDYAASSAASVYAGYCQTGGSGQTENGGFAVINSDQFCDHVRAAQVMLEAYKEAISHCRCEGVCTTEIATVERVCTGENAEKAQYYLAAYHENMKDAHDMVQNTQATGLIGRISGQLAIPAALIAALFIL